MTSPWNYSSLLETAGQRQSPVPLLIKRKSALRGMPNAFTEALQSGVCTSDVMGDCQRFSRYRTDCRRVILLLSEDDVKKN